MGTMTLTIRDHKGACLESEVGTRKELDAFLERSGYPVTMADLLGRVEPIEDDDGQTYFLAT